ncbi:MAG: indolepyruvate ferredoxin oxidoreductase family protein [Hyphomicrobiales bacterium]|nr:indolepyruvate ferredoxin oxidoreductase family protein [Hyphomicrobiales bacterium]
MLQNTALDDTSAPRRVSLLEKYLSSDVTVLLSGTQALVRLMLEQSRADKRAGLNTAGFVSGYRGSPLGGVDQAFWAAADHLDPLAIRFEPGLNEDLAATAVWGTQQSQLLGGGPYDGVFALWYGKNPGVDRCGDVFKHANISGTSPHGGMLAISGDDPGATSSALANQCEQSFAAALMPVLYPADVADILSFGRFGFEMSRYSGLWVAMKLVADTVESTATVDLNSLQNIFTEPDQPVLREQVITRWPDDRWSQDRRLQEVKLPAAIDFAAANKIDRVILGKTNTRRSWGIVSAGKACLDVLEALAMLGIDEAAANEIGLSVYKVGMIWPLEPAGLQEFAEGLNSLIVVEERRAFLETQIKDIAYHWKAGKRPDILGKTDLAGKPLFASTGETTPCNTAIIIGEILTKSIDHPALIRGLRSVKARKSASLRQNTSLSQSAMRIPHFCAGCPHSRSTELPRDSIAMAGIGCHSLAMWMDGSNTRLLTQMGGEGANWIGASAFVDMPHIFQNMGDGTYNHSGMLAIRAAVAANTTITYKILFNDAVAMTGGQPAEGSPTVGDIARQILAERVGKVVVVSDNPKLLKATGIPAEVFLCHRNSLVRMMEDCKKWLGVSVIIYDQVCATEKRRRIKNATTPRPPARVVINQMVCEGCGDCSIKSGCVAIESVDTPFDNKRRINQSVCNTDLSCLDGFCPAMVTVEGDRIKGTGIKTFQWDTPLPNPVNRKQEDILNILIAGVGGTGLITIGAIIGMAAHIDGVNCTILDNTGLARKGGGVTTHVRISGKKHNGAPRIDIGGCNLLLAGDPIMAASPEVISRLAKGQSHSIVNSHAIPIATQSSQPDPTQNVSEFLTALRDTTGKSGCITINASALARTLLGDDIFANMILLGAAYQDGQIPITENALIEAIKLNGVAVESNLQAFDLGRRFIADPNAVIAFSGIKGDDHDENINATITRLENHLAQSHGSRIATKYRNSITEICEIEADDAHTPGSLSYLVAQNYHRLLSTKDEYEVARLMSNGEFDQEISKEFENITNINYHFASPFLGARAGTNNREFKVSLGQWFRPVLRLLASLKSIRGTIIDPFRYQSGRRLEQRLIVAYSADIERMKNLAKMDATSAAKELANWPDIVRGFGPVKARNTRQALANREKLIDQYNTEIGFADGSK